MFGADRRIVLLGLAAGLMLPSRVRAADVVQAGAVDSLSGQVSAETGGTARRLVASLPVFVDDHLNTGSDGHLALTLTLGTGPQTRLVLGPGSVLHLKQVLASGRFQITLERGAMSVAMADDAKVGPGLVNLPLGQVVARGAELLVVAGPDTCEVWLGRGGDTRVQDGTGGSVALAARQGTTLRAHAAPEPAGPWSAARLAAARAKVG